MFFFLSQSKTELAMFLFQLFDPDDSDSLTGDELRVLAKCINPGVTQSRFGRRYKRRNTNERKDLGLSLFDIDGDQEISSSEFLVLIYNNQNLKIVDPLFHLQKRLRDSTLGASRWQWLETQRTRVLYQVNVHTGEAHPNKEKMKKCLYFSKKFGLSKIFQLNNVPESDYMESYDARSNKGERTERSKDKVTVNHGKEKQPSKTVRKGSVAPTDYHEHHEEIVKIQSRMRGVMGRQNSKKLRLEKDMENDNGRKPRRSSIVGDKRRGSAVAIAPI